MNLPPTQPSNSQERLGVRDGIPVVSLRGEIDLVVAPDVQARIDEFLLGGSSTVIVDLSQATFLDSIALGVLVGALEQCRDAGGDLHLIVTDPRILKVLEITDLISTFSIHSELTDSYVSVGS